MQFGHRVKSVTLAEYKPEEVEAMRDGGNQVRHPVDLCWGAVVMGRDGMS